MGEETQDENTTETWVPTQVDWMLPVTPDMSREEMGQRLSNYDMKLRLC